jgi:hypothetical protein
MCKVMNSRPAGDTARGCGVIDDRCIAPATDAAAIADFMKNVRFRLSGCSEPHVTE